MSTYLVAFVIGAYDYVETYDRNHVLIRVYTSAEKKDRGLFALEVNHTYIHYRENKSFDNGSYV
jgi:aminopeptidase N